MQNEVLVKRPASAMESSDTIANAAANQEPVKRMRFVNETSFVKYFVTAQVKAESN